MELALELKEQSLQLKEHFVSLNEMNHILSVNADDRDVYCASRRHTDAIEHTSC